MGKPNTSAREIGTAFTGAFSATGASSAFRLQGHFNFSLYGTFVATVSLERSFDGGTTWLNCTRSDGSAGTFTAPVSLVCLEPEAGVLYRLNCSAYTSGTVSYRLSK